MGSADQMRKKQMTDRENNKKKKRKLVFTVNGIGMVTLFASRVGERIGRWLGFSNNYCNRDSFGRKT